MTWHKRGRLVDGPGTVPWAVSHAMLPTLRPRRDGDLDVYFSGRDGEGRSRIGRRTLKGESLMPVRDEVPDLALDLGPLGAFDDSGCQPSWCVDVVGRSFLYYNGWTVGRSVPFYFFVGLAEILPGGRLARLSPAPILERTSVDPYLTASPCVLVEAGIWRMWYVSCVRWTLERGRPKHYYHVKYAESRDGIEWERRGIVCIDFASPDEYAIARPCVVRDGGLYRMWYTYRGTRYRIGYAESGDGVVWQRRDREAALMTASEGWDSEMVAYPFVFDWRNQRYMLYNGNGYGRTGFGLAQWTDE